MSFQKGEVVDIDTGDGTTWAQATVRKTFSSRAREDKIRDVANAPAISLILMFNTTDREGPKTSEMVQRLHG